MCTAVECRDHGQCAATLACVNEHCADPCAQGGPCTSGQECAVVDHQPVCSKGTYFLILNFLRMYDLQVLYRLYLYISVQSYT